MVEKGLVKVMEAKGSSLLKISGILFFVLGVLSFCMQVGGVFFDDLIGSVQRNAFGQILILDSSRLGVGMLVSVAEMAVGALGIKMAENFLYAKYLRWYGIGMIILYVIEAMFYYGMNGNVHLVGYIVMIVLSIVYLIGAIMNEKSYKAEK